MSRPRITERRPAALLPPPKTRAPAPAPAPNKPKEGEGGRPAKTPKLLIGLVLLAIALLLGYGAWRHWRQAEQAAQTQEHSRDFVPTVRVAEAKREQDPIKTVLPAQTEAFETATIFARATGYVAERRVDIGSRVKKGDLLLRISAPDLDQQLAQAEAQVEQTKAALDQARSQVASAKSTLALQATNLARANTLTRQGFETVQNQQTQQTTVQNQQASLATAQAGVKVSEANLKVQQATVERLKALTAFERVTAPFDGVVTTRNVEVGDLVNADQGTGTPLFRVDEDDVLRVAIRVPQYASAGVKDGLDAKVTAPQMPGRVFKGKVSRTSVALMYSSRTLTTEVDIANPDGALSPGQFVDVEIDIPRTAPSVSVPADSLIFDQRGAMVATVEGGNKIKLHRVEIYRDLGASLELKSGLNGGESVVLDAPADISDGARVNVAASKGAGKQGHGSAKGA